MSDPNSLGFDAGSPPGFSEPPSQASNKRAGGGARGAGGGANAENLDGSMNDSSFLDQPSQFFENSSLPRFFDQSSLPEGSPTGPSGPGDGGEEGLPWELNGEKVEHLDQITLRLEEKIKRNFKHFIEFYTLRGEEDAPKRRRVEQEDDGSSGRGLRNVLGILEGVLILLGLRDFRRRILR